MALVRGTELAPGAALHFIAPLTDIAHSMGLHVVLAGHVAWEQRVGAMSELHVRPTLLDLDGCPLTAYARDLGAAADRTHQDVHREALTQRGAPEHRSAWERLLLLVERT